MERQSLEDLTIEQLIKKEKDATSILIVLIVCYSICIIGLLILKPWMAATIIPLLVTVLPIAASRKKIKAELLKRGQVVK